MNSDDHLWQGSWDVEGIRCDDRRAVPIRIGVIDYDDTETIAISVGERSPVAITHYTATEIAELCGWAIREHQLIAGLRHQRATHGKKEELDRAILTRDQWDAIRQILHHRESIESSAAEVALNQLHNAAPASWLGSERGTAR